MQFMYKGEMCSTLESTCMYKERRLVDVELLPYHSIACFVEKGYGSRGTDESLPRLPVPR